MKIYSKDSSERWRLGARNQDYLLLHNIVFCLIYGALIAAIDAETRNSTLTILFLLIADLCGAMVFRDFLMAIPSYFVLRPVYPEIYLSEDSLVYLGGSKILNYAPLLPLLPFFKSMFATTPSIAIPRTAGIQADIVRGKKGLAAPWKHELELRVVAGDTVIRCCGWLDETELSALKTRLDEWMQQSKKSYIDMIEPRVGPDAAKNATPHTP
jgi:hypothetical protein